MTAMKTCTVCREIKPATSEFFPNNRTKDGRGDGLGVACKPCHSKRTQAYRAKRRASNDTPRCGSPRCDRPAMLGGLCEGHYQRLRYVGHDAAERPFRRTERRESDVCIVDGCARNPYRRDMCNGHYIRWRRHGDPTGGKVVRVYGERRIKDDGYVMITAPEGGRVLEHRTVMADLIGRPLLPEETVHHRNGVRSDNRPKNLELWISRQPSGQRAVDLVEWANEILSLYPPEVLAALAEAEVEVVAIAA